MNQRDDKKLFTSNLFFHRIQINFQHHCPLAGMSSQPPGANHEYGEFRRRGIFDERWWNESFCWDASKLISFLWPSCHGPQKRVAPSATSNVLSRWQLKKQKIVLQYKIQYDVCNYDENISKNHNIAVAWLRFNRSILFCTNFNCSQFQQTFLHAKLKM